MTGEVELAALLVDEGVLLASSKSSAKSRRECWLRAALVSLSWTFVFSEAVARGRFQVVVRVLWST